MKNSRIAAGIIGKKCIGFESLDITSAVVVTLTPPAVTDPNDRAYYAIMVLECDGAETELYVPCRFREDGTAPTTILGVPLGKGEKYELQGYDQITNFKIIGTNTDPLITNRISIHYYKMGDQ